MVPGSVAPASRKDFEGHSHRHTQPGSGAARKPFQELGWIKMLPAEARNVRLMCRERSYPPLERGAGVDPVIRLRRVGSPDSLHTAPRLEAALGQLFGEYPPVGCVTYRIYGRSTGNDVIGLVEGPPAPGLAEIVGDHNLRAVLADDPADHSAQGHAVLQNPVRQPQKLHDVDTDELRRLDLLCLTHSAALIWGQTIDARLTAGDHRVTDGFARVGPPGHGRRRAELKIIRMRHDAQGGAPRLIDGCKIRHSVRLIR